MLNLRSLYVVSELCYFFIHIQDELVTRLKETEVDVGYQSPHWWCDERYVYCTYLTSQWCIGVVSYCNVVFLTLSVRLKVHSVHAPINPVLRESEKKSCNSRMFTLHKS